MPNRGSALQTYYFMPTFARASTKSTLLLPTCTLFQPDWGAFSTPAYCGQKLSQLATKGAAFRGRQGRFTLAALAAHTAGFTPSAVGCKVCCDYLPCF